MKNTTRFAALLALACAGVIVGCSSGARTENASTMKAGCSGEAACAEGKTCSKGEACCNAKAEKSCEGKSAEGKKCDGAKN